MTGDNRRSARAVSKLTSWANMTDIERQQHKRRSDLSGRLFYVGVVLTFTALSVGIAYVAPVLSYDCQRDDQGVVHCTVHRTLYGLIPLPAKRLTGVVSVDTEVTSHADRSLGVSIYEHVLQTYYALTLKCADGTRWTSFRSTEPLGMSNEELAGGIKELLATDLPQKFHGWTAEKVPLVVGAIFLAPAAIVLLALFARILLFRKEPTSF
jgi:hypothetical protein